MTQEKLDAQRDVVRNERRQTQREPALRQGRAAPAGAALPRGPPLPPPGHRLARGSPGGDRRRREGVLRPLVRAQQRLARRRGRLRSGQGEGGRSTRLFGCIPAAAGAAGADAGARRSLTGVVRETHPGQREAAKIVMAWHSPARFAPGDADLDLLAEILRDGKASRLYKALVYDHPLAQNVTAEQHSQDLDELLHRRGHRAAGRLARQARGRHRRGAREDDEHGP